MAYHINLQGEVKPCTAQYACRFGSFETDHYTTEEQARTAYELSMRGKTVDAAHSRETFFKRREAVKSAEARKLEEEQRAERKTREEAEEAAAREKERRDKWLRKMKTPKTRTPYLGEPGHFYTVLGPEPGTIDDEGRRVLEVMASPHPVTEEIGIVWMNPKGQTEVTYHSQGSLEKRQVWSDEHSPEVIEAYEAALDERNAEDFLLNHMRFPLRWAVAMQERSQAEKNLATRFRIFKEKAKDFEKSGIAYPYSRALTVAVDAELPNSQSVYDYSPPAITYGDTAMVMRWLVTGRAPESQFFSENGAKRLANDVFLAGRVPMVDHDPRSILKEREDRELL